MIFFLFMKFWAYERRNRSKYSGIRAVFVVFQVIFKNDTVCFYVI